MPSASDPAGTAERAVDQAQEGGLASSRLSMPEQDLERPQHAPQDRDGQPEGPMPPVKEDGVPHAVAIDERITASRRAV